MNKTIFIININCSMYIQVVKKMKLFQICVSVNADNTPLDYIPISIKGSMYDDLNN